MNIPYEPLGPEGVRAAESDSGGMHLGGQEVPDQFHCRLDFS